MYVGLLCKELQMLVMNFFFCLKLWLTDLVCLEQCLPETGCGVQMGGQVCFIAIL